MGPDCLRKQKAQCRVSGAATGSPAESPSFRARSISKAWGAHREWHRLRLLSDDGPAFARAIDAEDADGRPDSTIVVFAKDGDTIRHVYTAHPMLEDRERGIDLLCPVWHLFDLMPCGRDDWYGSNEGFDASLRPLATNA